MSSLYALFYYLFFVRERICLMLFKLVSNPICVQLQIKKCLNWKSTHNLSLCTQTLMQPRPATFHVYASMLLCTLITNCLLYGDFYWYFATSFCLYIQMKTWPFSHPPCYQPETSVECLYRSRPDKWADLEYVNIRWCVFWYCAQEKKCFLWKIIDAKV